MLAIDVLDANNNNNNIVNLEYMFYKNDVADFDIVIVRIRNQNSVSEVLFLNTTI